MRLKRNDVELASVTKLPAPEYRMRLAVWPLAICIRNEEWKKKNSTNVKLNLAISTNIPFILHSLNDDSLLIHIRIHSQYMSSEFVQKRS